METPPIFKSIEDECRYWKEKAAHYHKEWSDVKHEFDEFVEDSRQLEAEMEATLEQKETVVRDLRKQIVQLEKENESLRMKLDSFSIEFGNLEKQLATTQKERDNMKVYLRQLEQKNDDLERAHRILSESIGNFEAMLDKAYEKNALLEIEVDEKEVLQEKLQRLMDETRDLKQELNIRARHPPTSNNLNGVIDKIFDDDECRIDVQTQSSTTSMIRTEKIPSSTTTNNVNKTTESTINNTTDSFKHSDNMLNGNAITASSRTTALNIVADMLRKLNLDTKFLCSRCDKFRCICERPISFSTTTSTSSTTINTTNSTISNQNSSILRNHNFDSNCNLSTGTSNSTIQSSSNNNYDNNINENAINLNNRSSSNNNLSTTSCSSNFGSNILKRLSQKLGSGIIMTSDNNSDHAMESKLKAYRDQAPPAKQ